MPTQDFPMIGWRRMKRWLLLGVVLATWVRAGAVERTLRIDVPATVAAGQELVVALAASTDAGEGEQVGFLQAEASLDEGRTWTAICYLQKAGSRVVQSVNVKPGPVGTTVKVRVRAAYREGLAGDVDYTGAAIKWKGSWEEWKSPPTQYASVAVTAG